MRVRIQCRCSTNEVRRLAGSADISPVSDWLHRVVERGLLAALGSAERAADDIRLPETDRKT